MNPVDELARYVSQDHERLDLPTFDHVLARSASRRTDAHWLRPFAIAGSIVLALIATGVIILAPVVDIARHAAAPGDAIISPSLTSTSISVQVDAFRGKGRLAFSTGNELHVVDGSSGISRQIGTGGTAVWSHDAEWLAFTQGAGRDIQLWISRPDGTERQRVIGLPPGTGVVLHWSPTDDILAVAPQGDELSRGLWRIRVGEPAALLAAAETSVSSLAWSPDGRTIAYSAALPSADLARRSDGLFTIGAGGGSPERHLLAEQAGVAGLAWWPDGSGLLYHRVPQHSASLQADGVPLEALAFRGSTPSAFAEARIEFSGQWIDDRRFIAVVGAGRWPTTNKSLAICELETVACRVLPALQGTVSLEPAISFDRTRVAFVRATDRGDQIGFSDESDSESWMRTRKLVVMDLRTGTSTELTNAGAGVARPEWARNDREVLFASDRAAWIYDLQGNTVAKLIEPLDNGSPFGGSGWTFDWHR